MCSEEARGAQTLEPGLLHVALAVAYAASAVSVMRVRSWKARHRVVMRLLQRTELEGVRELAQEGEQSEDDEEASEIDSFLSPFSHDLVFGVEADGELVGLDTVRLDRSVGHVEDVKLAPELAGHGLEELLRRFTLESPVLPQHGVRLARHLAFAWNEHACRSSELGGMEVVARWHYNVLDGHAAIDELLVASREAAAPGARLAAAPSLPAALAALRCACDCGRLLQCWDIHDLDRETLRLLCSSLPDEPDEPVEALPASPRLATSERGTRAYPRFCTVQTSPLACSVGELVAREGAQERQLCTFTLYCSNSALRRSRRACLAEAYAHAAYWAGLASRAGCDSLVVFVSSELEDGFAVPGAVQRDQLVLYEKVIK